VLKGYISQYDYYVTHKIAPSAVNSFIESLPKEEQVSNTYIFLNNNFLPKQSLPAV
jgi:hypothetical protein